MLNIISKTKATSKTMVLVMIGAFSVMGQIAIASGDAEAGKAKSVTCAACHGAEGISAIPANPNLAGQVPGYIADQLAAFKSGERKNAVMTGMSAPLSAEDMADLDAYYVSLKAASGNISEAEKDLALEGEKIYRGGYAERSIAACMSCHGPSGHGIPRRYPRVSGQHKGYLEAQLLAFKKGDRKGYNGMMWEIAFSLSEQQIKALATYMSGLE